VRYQWLVANGASFSGVKLAVREPNGPNCGVFLEMNTPRGAVIMSIPRHALITATFARANPVVQEVESICGAHAALALFLLEDMTNESSMLQPYYKALPTLDESSFLPIFWPDQQLSGLCGSSLIRKLQKRREEWTTEYDKIVAASSTLGRHGEMQFLWARSHVEARNYGGYLHPESVKEAYLAPLADFMNHRRPRETSWEFNGRTQCFEVTALNDLEAGVEVHSSWGAKSNARYMLTYGFTVHPNVEDGKLLEEVCTRASPAKIVCNNTGHADRSHCASSSI
jgi:histone-lysine N-methyltransferase SETD3